MRKLILKKPYEMEMTQSPVPEPADDQVRIHVKKIGICGSDPTIYKGLHPYAVFPLVMGHELSGVIEKVGKNVSASRVGQRVTVIPHIVCDQCDACKTGIYNFCEELKCAGAEDNGAHCDYFCIDQRMAIEIPETMTMEEAAMVEPACVAYHGARRGQIQPGENVLVIGAGPIGIFCMQSCRALGAGKVGALVAQPLYEEAYKTMQYIDILLQGGEVDMWTDLVAPIVTADGEGENGLEHHRGIAARVAEFFA